MFGADLLTDWGMHTTYRGRFKADSHIACLAHAAPIPYPCHAVALRV